MNDFKAIFGFGLGMRFATGQLGIEMVKCGITMALHGQGAPCLGEIQRVKIPHHGFTVGLLTIRLGEF